MALSSIISKMASLKRSMIWFGQSAVTHTLKNAISNHKRVMLTYLQGLVGQEKRSAAKVFAKGH